MRQVSFDILKTGLITRTLRTSATVHVGRRSGEDLLVFYIDEERFIVL
jgi:hypothetical protein